MSFNETWKQIPGWQKGIIIIGGGAVTAFTVWQIIGAVQAANERRNSGKTIKQVEQELTDVLKVQKPNYPDSVYMSWANQIQKYVNGCDAYVHDPSIFLIIKNVRNTADWLKLVKAFGVRKIEGCGFSDDYEAELPLVIQKETMPYIHEGINNYFKSGSIAYKI